MFWNFSTAEHTIILQIVLLVTCERLQLYQQKFAYIPFHRFRAIQQISYTSVTLVILSYSLQRLSRPELTSWIFERCLKGLHNFVWVKSKTEGFLEQTARPWNYLFVYFVIKMWTAQNKNGYVSNSRHEILRELCCSSHGHNWNVTNGTYYRQLSVKLNLSTLNVNVILSTLN